MWITPRKRSATRGMATTAYTGYSVGVLLSATVVVLLRSTLERTFLRPCVVLRLHRVIHVERLRRSAQKQCANISVVRQHRERCWQGILFRQESTSRKRSAEKNRIIYKFFAFIKKSTYLCSKLIWMGTKDKLIERFKSQPKDFTWQELVRLFGIFGYTVNNTRKNIRFACHVWNRRWNVYRAQTTSFKHHKRICYETNFGVLYRKKVNQ